MSARIGALRRFSFYHRFWESQTAAGRAEAQHLLCCQHEWMAETGSRDKTAHGRNWVVTASVSFTLSHFQQLSGSRLRGISRLATSVAFTPQNEFDHILWGDW
jgi:hypothetical protein